MGTGAQHHDDVADPADLVTVGVEHGDAGEPGEEHPRRAAAQHAREVTAVIAADRVAEPVRCAAVTTLTGRLR